ncbi:MAG: hypothetical protein Phyf2KO_23760 [Phycisphaerales bacterium]
MTDVGRIPGGNEALRTEAIGRAAGRSDETSRSQPGVGVERGSDTVDVSDEARSAAARLTADATEIRQDLVDRVRAQIESGEYESPVKIAGTIDNMLDSIS